MKVNHILDVMDSDKVVTIVSNKESININKPIYQIKWHNKELLNREVQHIGVENDKLIIFIGVTI